MQIRRSMRTAWGLSLLAAAPAAARPVATAEALSIRGEQTIAATVRVRRLTVAPGAAPRAPAGSNLTLTVDGVGTDLAPGSYTGDVVLSVTRDIPVRYKKLDPHHYRAGIYVDDGRYVADKSVAAIARGEVTDRGARNVVITDHGKELNGILVAGRSTYLIDHPVITLLGNGGNDFAGFGAAIMSTDHADVTVDHARILTRGVVRPALFVGGDSVMRVNDSDIDVRAGTLPKDYRFTLELGKMKEVPWMLGLRGNVRASNLVDGGTVYYTRSHIRVEGWGALSTDDTRRVRMYVKDSTIETVGSGYGAYSIGDSIDSFSHSTFDVATYALIIAAQGSGIFTDGTVVNSRRYGVMFHSGGGAGTLTIDGKSVFNTASTAIEVKGRGGVIVIDDARIHPGNGIILQAMLNDDPFAAGPATGPVIGVQSAAPTGPAGLPADMPRFEPNPPVKATIRHAALTGDIINSRTSQGDLDVTLDHAALTGAISTAVQSPVSGQAPTQATLDQIGAVKNRLGPGDGGYGLSVTVTDGSRWTVTKSSFLTRLVVAPDAGIAAPAGRTVTMTVDGKPQAIVPGTYAGRVALAIR